MNSLDDLVEMMWDQAFWMGHANAHDDEDWDYDEDLEMEVVAEWKAIFQTFMDHTT